MSPTVKRPVSELLAHFTSLSRYYKRLCCVTSQSITQTRLRGKNHNPLLSLLSSPPSFGPSLISSLKTHCFRLRSCNATSPVKIKKNPRPLSSLHFMPFPCRTSFTVFVFYQGQCLIFSAPLEMIAVG